MSKFRVGIFTRDKSWFRLFSKYVQMYHTSSLEVILCQSLCSAYEENLDISLIDKCEKIDDFASLNKKDIGRHLYLINNSEESFTADSVYKYVPADQLVNRLLDLVKGAIGDKNVKHIVVSSAVETRTSYDLCEYIGQNSLKGKTLLLSFSYFDALNDPKSREINDPFGRLVYYASESEDKLFGSLDVLVTKKAGDLHTILKPYPFDASLWNQTISENVIRTLNKQSQYKTIIWHLGSVYSLGFGEILQSANNFLWFGNESDLLEDNAFLSYQGLSGCRLDLKTTLINLKTWDGNYEESVSKCSRIAKEIKGL